MSEEEAINILCTIKNIYYMNNFGKCDKAIETILDLYKQEKEKNKKLIEGQAESLEKLIILELLKKYISKDKIREKIKKYQELDKKEFAKQGNFKCEISVLQELLEEEN